MGPKRHEDIKQTIANAEAFEAAVQDRIRQIQSDQKPARDPLSGAYYDLPKKHWLYSRTMNYTTLFCSCIGVAFMTSVAVAAVFPLAKFSWKYWFGGA